MKWNQYHIFFSLKGPLHVGYRKVGNLMQTRPYVLGKNLWAALTTRLTRDRGLGANGQAYVNISSHVKQHFRFSYLWPAISYKDVTEVKKWDELETFFSFKVTKGIEYLQKIFPHPKLSQENLLPFEYLFLDSYASTALDHYSRSAEEGTLHETEFIVPYTKNGQPVYLVGSLWVDEDLPEELENWNVALCHIRLGGEHSYGWGRVQLINCEPAGNNSINPDDFFWSGPIPAHVKAEDAEKKIQGPIEPLVGWETQKNGKQDIGKSIIVFVPGASIKNDNSKFAIRDFGIWEIRH